MSLSDLFSTTYIAKASALPLGDMFIALGLSFALGLFIYFVYRKTFVGVMYSRTFSIALIGLCMITAMVILAVNSNVILSLSMVGALSIVRFRTAVKDPIDIVFLFWAIIGGIILGAGLIPLAIFGSLFVGLVLILALNKKSRDIPYMLILQLTDTEAEERAVNLMRQNTLRDIVKSKSVSSAGIELTCEVRLRENATAFVNAFNALEGVSSAVLVAAGGENLA